MPSTQFPSMDSVDSNGRFQITVSIFGPVGKQVNIPGFVKFTIPTTLRLWDDEEDWIIQTLHMYDIKQFSIKHYKW